jgi:hypothetical protein
MAIKYLYDGEVFSPEDVEIAATRRNMNPQDYAKQFNIELFDDVYQKDGIDVPFEQIVDESTKSGVKVSDYISSNNFKKKALSIPQDQSLLTGTPEAGKESKAGSPLQSPSLSVSEPINPKKLSQERIKLLADLQKVKDNPATDQAVTDEFGTQPIYTPRTDEINSIQTKIDELDGKLAGAGYKVEEYDTLANLPDWVSAEGGWANPKNIARYSLENPAWGDRFKSRVGAMDAFIANNDYQGAKELQDLLVPSKGQPNTVADLNARFQMINTLAESRVPQSKDKVKQYVNNYLKPEFNRFLPDLNKQSMEAYKLDSDQEAALQEMKLLNPEKYKDVIGMLMVPYQQTVGTGMFNKPLLQWDLDKQRGLEKVRYDLKVAGRNNAINYASSRLYDWKSRYDKATSDEERANAALQMEQWGNRIDAISQEAKDDQKNYPLYYEDQNKRAVTDLLDDPDFNPFTYAWKTATKKIKTIAEGVGELAISPVNAVASLLVGPEYEGARMATKIGQAEAEATESYLPASMQFVEPGALISPSKDLKSFVDKVKASGKPEDEQRKEIESYLQNNPNSYEHVENPNAGERKGVFSEAGVYANIKTAADIAVLAGTGTMTRAYKILGPTMSSTLPFYMDVQQESYKQRIAAGENSSTAYQNSVKDGMVVASATLISPIHKIASAALGKSSNAALKNTIGGLTESEWNAITSKYNRYILAGSNSLKAMAKEGAKMGAVYGAGTTVGQELLEITPDKKDFKEIIQNGVYASYDMLTSSALLLGLTGINNFKTISPQAKQSIYTMANDHLGAKAYFDFLQKNGTISQESATQKKAVVDKLVNVLSQVPVRDKNGKPLTEEQRSGYLYREYQKQQAAEMSKTMPEETKTEIDTKVKEMDADNAKIINGTLESDLTPSAAEPVATPIDKQKISINVAPEITRIKALDINAEDGATFNLDGTKYEGKGLVVPVVAENLAKGEVTEQKMAEFVAKHGDKVGELTKPGVFKFPGEDKVSLDLNIVVDAKNKDVALEFARRAGHKSLFDLDTMTYIETGATGEKPMDFTADQFKEINRALSKGEMPNVFGEKAEGFTAETAKTIDTTGMNEVQKGVIADAPNVLSAITPVMGEAGKKPQLFTYKTDAEYGKAVEGAGGTKEDSATKGFYMDTDGSIHINLNRATPETMMHEGFHPMLNLLAENKPEVIQELFRQLDTIPVAKAMIDKARRNYMGDVTQMKEAITDFNARVAKGEIKLDATTFEQIKQFFVDLMNKMGFSIEGKKIANMKDAAELKSVAELIQKAFTTGEAIKGTEIKDIQAAIEKANQKRVETGEMSAGEKEGGLMFSRTDYGTSGITKKPALDKEEYKAEVASGRISVVDPYKSLENKKFAMTFPDDFFTGTIEVNGEPIGYGNGGVFYTAKHGKRGDAWASVSEGSASNFVTQANKSLEANKGEGIVAIVKGDDMKHKTSLESKVTFVNTILKYAEKTGDTAGVVKAIKSAYNLGNVKDPAKIIEYFNNYLASGRAESGQRMIDAGVSFDTFMASMIKEARPAVTKMMQDMGYKGENFFDGTQLKKGVEIATTKGLKNVYSDMLREDFLKDVKPGSAYAAIKFTSPLKFEKDPAHPSYPYVIRTVDGSPVKLEVFDRTFNTYGKDVAVTGKERDETKAFGVATTVSPEFSIKPEMKGNQSEVSLSQQLTGYEALKPSAEVAPEFSKEDLVEKSGARKQMTEDDKGNYLFYHYSGADLKSIDPKKFGKNLATGRDERPGIGISMYYTRPDVLEANVPSDYGYAVRIPKNKVYPFNKDPLNLLPAAEKAFKKMYPDQAFDMNKQVAFVTQEAAKKGYPMTVAEWNIKGRKVLRAQTTEAMKPERYSNIVPGTMNQVEYNPELSKFKPNIKRRDIEFSREEQKTAKDIISENIQIGKPERKGAVARFLENVGDENFNVNWMDRLGREFLDSLFVFDKAAERAKGIRGIDKVLPAEDPMTLVRLLNGFDASFNSAMDKGMFNAKLERIKSSDGDVMNLDWLLKPMASETKAEYDQMVKDITSYMVAKRTVELSKRFDREEMISGIGEGNVTDLEMAKQALKDFETDPNKDRIEEAAKRYREMADAGLRYMVDKGRLAEEVRDKDGNLIGGYKFIKENNLEYVALQRLNQTEAGEPIEFNIKKGGNVGGVSEPVKKIKGSEKRIQDPYVSLLDNLNKMMKESDRNEVVLSFRNLIENEQDPQMRQSLESIGKKVGSKDKETITVFVDGKPEYWKFQQDIYTALKGLDSEAYNLPGWLTVMPKVLRWTVTRFPTFAARNIVRDFQSRLLLSNANPWESIKRSITTADKWDEAARVGALNAGMYTQGKELYYELLGDAAKKLTKEGSFIVTPDKIKSLWNTYEKALYKSETTGRVSEYEASFNEAKKQGMDDYNAMLYAGSRARGLIDFAVAGNTMRVINQLIPFSNAAVQGLRSASMRVKENPAGFAMRVALFSLIPEVAMYSLNRSDEKKKKMYEALPDWQRDMFYNVYVGNNKWLAIPKPFELSLFGSALNRGMSYAEGNKKAFDGFGGTTYKSLMPIEGSEIIGRDGKMVEVAANYDFFRNKEIIPRSQLALDMSLRDTEDASRIGKVIGDFIKADPRMVDHYIKGQFSYFGKTALELSNMGRPKGEARDEFKLSEKSGFIKENSAYVSKPVQELRDFADKWGLVQHRWMKYFKMYQNNYFNEKDPKVKEQLGIEMMDFAEQLLALYKEVGIEELQKLKKDK